MRRNEIDHLLSNAHETLDGLRADNAGQPVHDDPRWLEVLRMISEAQEGVRNLDGEVG